MILTYIIYTGDFFGVSVPRLSAEIICEILQVGQEFQMPSLVETTCCRLLATPEAFPGDYQDDVNVHCGDSLSTDCRPDRFVGTLLYGLLYRRQHDRGRVDGSQLCFASDGG
jgi:hypothetical protein